MVKHRMGFRSVVALALCAFLSLLAFLGFLILIASSRGALAFLGLAAALACPAVWLAVLLSDSGGRIPTQRVRRAAVRLGNPARSQTKPQVQAGRPRENGV
jgi:hypothetical protein